eukprot:Opistho-2@4914
MFPFAGDDTVVLVACVAVAITTLVVSRVFFGGKKQLVALDPTMKIPFRLVEKRELSHDTRLYRFALQSEKHILGLPVGKHMYLSATIDGKPVSRPYTPTSSDDDIGHFDLVVKVYYKNVHPKFPEGGKMSQHLESLKLGETIDVSGPKGRLTYAGRGLIKIQSGTNPVEIRNAAKIAMIAGGTGITPMYQVIKAILKDPQDKTEVRLLFANQTEDDILLREELEKMAAQHSQFKVWYTLDRPPASGWKYSSGFVSEDMIREHLFTAGADTQVFMCGPPPMIKFACIPALEKIGFTEANHFTF